jgi:acetylornithine deacetylase/succinyl-diaminopimelate desuccinylase-like protein
VSGGREAVVIDPVLDYLERERPAILERLFDLIRIPSVSTDPDHAESMARAKDLLLERLRSMGLSNIQALEAGGHPAVYGEWSTGRGGPTLLIYGHYDVQPPDPVDRWESPPFEPTIRDGRIYGRGASDDKAPLSIALESLAAFLRVEGRLPLNVKVLLEGEEELGSPTLGPLFRKWGGLLGADALLSADGAMWRNDLVSVNVGSRGNAGFEFTVRTAGKDLHSGRFGGAVPNALHVMAELVAALHTADGAVAVPGFYQGAREVDAEQRRWLAAIPFDDAAFFAAIGVAPHGEPGRSTLERLWMRPCLDVNGMWGGYAGPGGKTVIPHEAHAKLTLRIVSGQDPEAIVGRVKDFLASRCPEGVDLSFDADRGSSAAYELAQDLPLLRAVEWALTEAHGSAPYRVRIGGTLPISDIARRELHIDTVTLSFSIADEDFHAPNEFFRLSSIDTGLRAWTALWRRLDETGL